MKTISTVIKFSAEHMVSMLCSVTPGSCTNHLVPSPGSFVKAGILAMIQCFQFTLPGCRQRLTIVYE